jgi:hypothetical protein
MNKPLWMSTIFSASVLSAIVGGLFILDCRINNGGGLKDCWMTGLPYMGIGAAGVGGYKLGFNTYNPALKRPEDEINRNK